ncbi:hypothetical protein HAX54_014854, partial [Datura stramonium]|nr:hypothetical protein [Datura stramonium]
NSTEVRAPRAHCTLGGQHLVPDIAPKTYRITRCIALKEGRLTPVVSLECWRLASRGTARMGVA